MKRWKLCTDKKMVRRAAAGIGLAAFVAFQTTGCGQTGESQGKESQARESQAREGQTGESQAGMTGAAQTTGKAAARAALDAGPEAAAGEDSVIEYKPGMPIQEGIISPDFTAELIDGTSITLSELQGRPVLINFWASWCGPCVKEMPAFERLKEDFGDTIGIIAVNCGENSETVKDFAEENGYTFPIALDEEYEISMLYPTNSIPYTVVVDGEGRVTHVSAGAADADTMYERYREALGM